MAPSTVAASPAPAPLPPGYELRQKPTALSALGQHLRRLRAAALEQPAALGCAAVLMVGLGLASLSVIEGLRILGTAQVALLDLASGLTLAMLLLVVALLSLPLLLSLGWLTRPAGPAHPSQPQRPLRQQWELCRQDKTATVVARLELIAPRSPSNDALELRRLRLGAKRDGHPDLGRQFVSAVLAQTPQRCYVQIPQSSRQAAQVGFFQSCGFVLSEAPPPNRRSPRRKAPPTWMIKEARK
jgi:hypothetical protein